jgi:hypothetical protein
MFRAVEFNEPEAFCVALSLAKHSRINLPTDAIRKFNVSSVRVGSMKNP